MIKPHPTFCKEDYFLRGGSASPTRAHICRNTYDYYPPSSCKPGETLFCNRCKVNDTYFRESTTTDIHHCIVSKASSSFDCEVILCISVAMVPMSSPTNKRLHTHVLLTIWWRFKIRGFVTSIYFHVQAWPTWRMWRVLRGGLPHSRHRPSSAEEKFASISKHVDGKKGVNRSLKKTWKSNEWKHEFLYHKRLSALWNHIQRQWGPSGEEVTHVTLRAKVYEQFNAGKEKTENPHHPTTRTARGKLPTATGHTWSLRLTQASSAYRFSSTHLTKMISGGVANTW